MDKLNEEIDLMLEQSLFEKEINLMLEQSLDEYAKADDFKPTVSSIDKLRTQQAKRFSGLDDSLAKEYVGLVRLAELAGPAAVSSVIGDEAFVPDFVKSLKEIYKL